MVVVFSTIMVYGNSSRVFVAGEPYLAVGSCAALIFVLASLALRAKGKRGKPEREVWLWRTRSEMSFFAAWQLLILALLNIWSALDASISLGVLVGSYLLTAGFVVFSDRMIAVAESPTQDGGSQPLDYFGRPRSRRILFWGLFVIPESTIAIFAIRWSFGAKPYPAAFHPPQICLLLVALSSAGSAIMTFQRYRTTAADKIASRVIVLATLLCFGMAGFAQLVLTYSTYVYLLSTFAVACIATSVYWLSRASMRDPVSPEGSPESSSAGGQGLTNQSAPIGEI
jgi:hypothetical protein